MAQSTGNRKGLFHSRLYLPAIIVLQMQCLLPLSLIAILIFTLVTPTASAQEISLICEDSGGNYALGTDPVAVGAEISCFVNPSEITAEGDGQILVSNPSGVTIIDQAAAEAGTTAFGFTTSEAGTYVITVTFIDSSKEQHQITGYVTASLEVIPESPVGMIAIVGSSLASLGAFTYLRRRTIKQ